MAGAKGAIAAVEKRFQVLNRNYRACVEKHVIYINTLALH